MTISLKNPAYFETKVGAGTHGVSSTKTAEANGRAGIRYYPAFDYLRIVLATAVTVDHARLFPFLSHLGGFSVQIFFALSGWLIGGILVRNTSADLVRLFGAGENPEMRNDALKRTTPLFYQ